MITRDPKMEAKIRRAAKRLGDLVGEYEAQLGIKLSLFAGDGVATVISTDRDAYFTSIPYGLHPPEGVFRNSPYEEGGSCVLFLPPGNTSWSGGGW